MAGVVFLLVHSLLVVGIKLPYRGDSLVRVPSGQHRLHQGIVPEIFFVSKVQLHESPLVVHVVELDASFELTSLR